MVEQRNNRAGLVVVVLLTVTAAALAAFALLSPLWVPPSDNADKSVPHAATTQERATVASVRAPLDQALASIRAATPWLCSDIVDPSQEAANADFYVPQDTRMHDLVRDARASIVNLQALMQPLDAAADTADIASVRGYDAAAATDAATALVSQAQAIEQEYGSYRTWLSEQDVWDMPPTVDLTGTESGDGIVASDGSLSFFNEHNGIVHLGAHDWSANGHMIASRPAYVIYGDSYYAYYESFVEKAHAEVLMRGPGASLWLQTCTGSNDNVVVNKYVRVG